MEKEKLDLQVGDKVTYKLINVKEHNIRIKSINNKVELDDFLLAIRNKNTITSIKILKIERPKYEVV